MQQSKQTISNNQIKRKDQIGITPFDPYNNPTKQRNIRRFSSSSRKIANRLLQDFDDKQNPNGCICLQHSQSINSVCFTCNFKLICQQCLKQSHGITSEHDVRTIEKSSHFVKNMLIHSQIKLEAKCNILTNINQQINNQKIQLFTEKNQYSEQLKRTFNHFHQILEIKQKEINQEIQRIFNQSKKIFTDVVDEIKYLQEYYDKCQQNIELILKKNAQNGADISVCMFYFQRKDIIEDIVKDTQLTEFKKNIYEVKFKLENGEIGSIIKSLQDLQVGYQLKMVYFDQYKPAQSKTIDLKDGISKVKSQNQLKLKPSRKKLKKSIKFLDLEKSEIISFPEFRQENQRESHKFNGTFCTSTPKEGISREKNLDFLKKSPQQSGFFLKKQKKSYAKMISMPVSPLKEQKDERQPSLNKAKDFIAQGMKKKSTLTKKKK